MINIDFKKQFPCVVYHQSDKNLNVHYALVKTLNVMITSILEYDYIYIYSNFHEKSLLFNSKDYIAYIN